MTILTRLPARWVAVQTRKFSSFTATQKKSEKHKSTVKIETFATRRKPYVAEKIAKN